MSGLSKFIDSISWRDFVRVLKLLAPHLRKYRKLFIPAYASLIAAMIMNLLKPWPLKLVLDYVILNEAMPDRIKFLDDMVNNDKLVLLSTLCACIVVIFALEGFFTFARKYFITGIGERTINDLRQQVYGHLQLLENGAGRSADFVVRLTSDIDSLKQLLIQLIQTPVGYFLTFAGIGITMFLLDRPLTILAFAVAPPLYVISLYFSVKIAMFTRRKRDKESAVASLVQETMASKEAVQAFVREDQEKKRFAEESTESMDASLEKTKASKAFGRMVEVIIAIGTALVVYLGARRALAGYITPGDLIIFISYLRDLYKPVGTLAESITDFSSSLVSGKRVAELLETKISVQEAPDAIEAPSFMGEITFEDVTFGYTPDKPVLQDLSFKVLPGQLVILIGSSGTGKTTIVNLVLRFYDPWKGRILIDGVDIRRYTITSLREQISVVLQEPLLFHRTVRENIAYGKPDATFPEIVDAAKASQAHYFISKLPRGYDTYVRNGGSNLSAGQRQRIALARAILKNTQIFIFDEPVSGLDIETEAELIKALERLMHGKTSFVIAHRFSTVSKADLILMIDEGKIVVKGTHAELLKNSERYRQLYELQSLQLS